MTSAAGGRSQLPDEGVEGLDLALDHLRFDQVTGLGGQHLGPFLEDPGIGARDVDVRGEVRRCLLYEVGEGDDGAEPRDEGIAEARTARA